MKIKVKFFSDDPLIIEVADDFADWRHEKQQETINAAVKTDGWDDWEIINP